MSTNNKLNLARQRRVAIGAVSSELIRTARWPWELDGASARVVLDDLARTEPDLIASQWYSTASEHQLTLFEREWNNRYRTEKRKRAVLTDKGLAKVEARS